LYGGVGGVAVGGGVGCGGFGGGGTWSGGERRVRESGVEGWIDRVTSNLFGFAEKIPPEKFSGGGVVTAGGRPTVAAAGGGEWGESNKKCVY
nr:hypothetical protein [Tanacetum cinerariifolium]